MNWRRRLHENLSTLTVPEFPAFGDRVPLPTVQPRARRQAAMAVEAPKPVGVLDGSDLAGRLEIATRKAIDRADEILELDLDQESDKFGDVLRGINTSIKTIITTQTKVDEHRLRARKLDVLPKLLEAIAAHEAGGKVVESRQE